MPLEKEVSRAFLLLGYGQSNSYGAEAWPAISPAAENCLMIGDDVRPLRLDGPGFEPLGEPVLTPLQPRVRYGHRICDEAAVAALPAGHKAVGETPDIAAALVLDRLAAAASGADAAKRPRIIVASCGVGGKAIEQLAKNNRQDGIDRYSRVTDALSLAGAAAGLTYDGAALLFIQGESDYLGSGMARNRAEYAAALAGLCADMRADAARLLGVPPPPVFVVQVGGRYTRNRTPDGQADLHVGMAAWDLCEHAEGVWLVGPYYAVTSKGGHLDANGVRWLGAKIGQVIHQVIAEQRAWRPLVPLSVTLSGSAVDIRFHVPAPPLQFAPSYYACSPVLHPSGGFRVSDASGDIPLAASIAAPDRVRLDLQRLPGGDARLWYADQRTAGIGNLCDSDSFDPGLSYTYRPGMPPAADIAALVGKPYDMRNRCIAFVLPIGWAGCRGSRTTGAAAPFSPAA